MSIPFTICYLTSRKEPYAEWFVDSLARQIDGHRINLIFLDYWSWESPEERKKYFEDLCARKPFESVTVSPPKPSRYQGPHRATKREYFAAANMRNTGFILCQTEYVVFVDDLSILSPEWLSNAYHAVEHRYVVLGSYCKADGIEAINGILTTPLSSIIRENPQHLDSRYHHGSDAGVGIGYGSWFFGCSFGGTIEDFSKVDGFDEGCDTLSFEDVCFGCRLERAGIKLHYNRNMMTIENNELHFSDGNAKMIRFDTKQNRELNTDPWQEINEQHKPSWLSSGEIDYSHYMLKWSQNNKKPYFNEYSLAEQREHYKETGEFLPATQPTRSLQTGQLLEDM